MNELTVFLWPDSIGDNDDGDAIIRDTAQSLCVHISIHCSPSDHAATAAAAAMRRLLPVRLSLTLTDHKILLVVVQATSHSKIADEVKNQRGRDGRDREAQSNHAASLAQCKKSIS